VNEQAFLLVGQSPPE